MFETTYINEQVKVGNSTNMTATKTSKWPGAIEKKYGTNKSNMFGHDQADCYKKQRN